MNKCKCGNVLAGHEKNNKCDACYCERNKQEIKELEQNIEIEREKLNTFLFLTEADEETIKDFWKAVNILIENEIDLEKLCN